MVTHLTWPPYKSGAQKADNNLRDEESHTPKFSHFFFQGYTSSKSRINDQPWFFLKPLSHLIRPPRSLNRCLLNFIQAIPELFWLSSTHPQNLSGCRFCLWSQGFFSLELEGIFFFEVLIWERMSRGASAYGSSLPKEIKPTSLRQKGCKVKKRKWQRPEDVWTFQSCCPWHRLPSNPAFCSLVIWKINSPFLLKLV